MQREYGLSLSVAESKQFKEWAASDPVSPAEKARELQLAIETGKENGPVARARPTRAGSCPWD
jgi:endonuclease I